jgi:hypothetical protein
MIIAIQAQVFDFISRHHTASRRPTALLTVSSSWAYHRVVAVESEVEPVLDLVDMVSAA